MEKPNLTGLEYLKLCHEGSAQVNEEQWKQADRALWAAYELMGLQGRIDSKASLDEVRACAMEILEAFPEGLPEPSHG